MQAQQGDKKRWTADELRAAVDAALGASPRTEDNVRAAVDPEFAEAFPAVVGLVCKEGFGGADKERLLRMLRLVARIDKGHMSEQDASVKIGTELMQEYVQGRV